MLGTSLIATTILSSRKQSVASLSIQKHLHDVEARFYCPQTLLTLDFSVGMTFLN